MHNMTFSAINILCTLAYEQCLSDVYSLVLAFSTPKFLKNFSKDTDVTQQKFIAQLVIQDETCIHNFDSELEQQSMQWNK